MLFYVVNNITVPEFYDRVSIIITPVTTISLLIIIVPDDDLHSEILTVIKIRVLKKNNRTQLCRLYQETFIFLCPFFI